MAAAGTTTGKGAQAPLIELVGASFGYGTRAVVSGVDLQVRRGLFLGVLGPNGSGKTTLLRGILQLLKPLRGFVRTYGATVGYVPQREHLDAAYPVTVEEVVHMGAYGRTRPGGRLSEADLELARDCMARVELLENRRSLFSSLSGGQRQRALIARALHVQPDVLLLDEPTSGVDAPTQELIVELFEALSREGMAVLMVTHEPRLIRELPETLWVEGGAVRRGRVEDVLHPDALARLALAKGG